MDIYSPQMAENTEGNLKYEHLENRAIWEDNTCPNWVTVLATATLKRYLRRVLLTACRGLLDCNPTALVRLLQEHWTRISKLERTTWSKIPSAKISPPLPTSRNCLTLFGEYSLLLAALSYLGPCTPIQHNATWSLLISAVQFLATWKKALQSTQTYTLPMKNKTQEKVKGTMDITCTNNRKPTIFWETYFNLVTLQKHEP